MVLAKNRFVLAKAPQKSLFWPKWLDFDKSCSKLSFFWPKWLSFAKSYLKLCVLAEITLVWQKYADKMSQNGKLVQKDQDGKPVQKNQNGKFVRMREIDELE